MMTTAATVSRHILPPPPSPAHPLRRKFQLTEFGNNHNKWWQIEVWDAGAGSVHMRTTWGRVGASPQTNDKVGTPAEVERMVAAKVAKGYREVDLHVPHITATSPDISPAAVAQTICPKVVQLLDLIFAEAGEQIASYLAVAVDALSQAQIQQGRDLLDQASRDYQTWRHNVTQANFARVVESVKAYYNTIPTQLPRNLRDTHVLEQVVLGFCRDLGEQETRLHQLEAALATYSAPTGPTNTVPTSLYDRLGARISVVSERDETYAQIVDFLHKTARHGVAMRLRDIFEIEVPSERAQFEANTFGKELVLRLTHGTNNANVRHILHEHGPGSGLRLPRNYTNGWMFGAGIYFANVASKSAQYCRGRSGNPHMLFLADVAVGQMYCAPRDMGATRAAPHGYHSLWGKAGHTKSWGGTLAYDEFIVYSQAQQSLRYLITWDPR